MRRLFNFSLALCLALAGCSKSPQELLIGTWSLGSATLEYAKDGTVYSHNKSGIERYGKWQVEGDVLQVEMDDKAFERVDALLREIHGERYTPLKKITRRTFKVTGDELTFTHPGGEVDRWRRQK